MLWPATAALVLEPPHGEPVTLLLQEPSQLALCADLLETALPATFRVDAKVKVARAA
jgi:hypothetical protein